MNIKDLPFYSCLSEPVSSSHEGDFHLGTQTLTEVSTEQTDKDPSFQFEISFGTETFTKTRGENTDKDPCSFYDFYNN